MNRSTATNNDWTTSAELMIELDARAETTKSARLRGALRDAIRDGRLGTGRRLPSSRALAADLGLSRGLVVDAYEQLVAEGYLVSAHGSGTSVAPNATARADPPPRTPGPDEWRIDFGPGTPDLAVFPRSGWMAAVRAAVRELPDADLAYGDPRGDEVLRTELAAYLARVRGAAPDPSRVFIVSGFTQGLGLVSRALGAQGVTHVGVEDPGAYVQRAAIVNGGLRVEPLPVDTNGVRTELLEGSSAGAVMVTPAHQYPLGGVLAPERRSTLIEWVRSQADRIIIEDDYDAEFRYDRSPVGTLHGLAPDHVVLGGSVSKSLAPALRVGWITVPPRLLRAVEELQQVDYAHPSTIDQRALAVLLSSGRYDRHIRRSRAAYRAKRDILLEALAGASGVTVGGVAAGLHLSVELPVAVDESTVIRELSSRGVRAQGLGLYRIEPGPPGLVLGYAHLTPDEIRTGAAAIVDTVYRQL